MQPEIDQLGDLMLYLDPPPILYKYRSWNVKYHKDFLQIPTLWFASPKTFEDENDSRNIPRYDKLTDRQAYIKFLQISKELNPQFIQVQHEDFAKSQLNDTRFRNKEYMIRIQDIFQNAVNNNMGVLSLSMSGANEYLMWRKYANAFHGIRIGYDTEKLLAFLFGKGFGGGPVIYDKLLPEILPSPFMDISEQHIKRIYFKEQKWDFEDEYRINIFREYTLTDRDRLVEIDSDVIKEVTLGYILSNPEVKEINQIVRNKLDNVIVNRATYCEGGVIIN
jgi:hypothetical protein